MTAPHARQPQVRPRPACTPTAIRAVLAANADSGTLQRYDQDLDARLSKREQGDVTPLVQTVKRWWFEADAWRDPQAQHEFLARIDGYRDGDLPPADQRMSRKRSRPGSASDACTGGSWTARPSRSSPAGADRARSVLDPIIVGGSLMGDLYDKLHDRGLVITHGVGECV
jgi:Family of unknown function (DUF6247)